MFVWRHLSRQALVLCSFLIAFVARTARADATDDRRALVMLRVLAYDKRLGERVGDEVRILILYPDGDAGAAERTRWATAFGAARKLRLAGHRVVVTTHKLEDLKNLDQLLESLRPAALVTCDGLTAKISVGQLAALTRAHAVLSITTREAEVAKGFSVGIVPGKPRDEIVINVRAATAEGVKFDAGLLQLARTVEERR
jgi:hypothetical protein